ncbi:MAG: hypothetical protein IJJ69_13215 [Oscillospiraceae bacterium]|nr:hypothetical protein [Oscillospiraceae bacterium]
MRDFLLASAPVMIWVLTIAELIIAVLLLKIYREKKHLMPLFMGLVCIGLVYDALVIAVGAWIPQSLIFALSRLRFISHGVLVPLNLITVGYAMKWDGIKLKVMYGIAGILSLLGLASGIARKLETAEIAGIIRCKSSDLSPSWAEGINNLISYGTVFPLIIFGIIIRIKQKTPFIYLSGLLMFVFAALGPATGNFDLIFYVSMFGELFMVLFFWLYARKYTEAET